MAKIHGKVSSFELDNNEICFQNASTGEDWAVRDATDSCTVGDGEETVLGRKTEVIELSGYLKNGGSRISCKAIQFTFNSQNFKARNITLVESAAETDATDGGTAGDGTETVAGFVNRKSTLQFLMLDTVAEPARNDAKAATLTFATGHTVAGTLRLESLSSQVNVKDMIGVNASGTWQGGITKTGLGAHDVGDAGSVKMIYKTGATSKARTGNAVLTGISITGDYDDDLKVTYTFKVNGGLSEAQYSD